MNQDEINGNINSITTSWVERQGASHWSVAVFWMIVLFFMFQITASVVVVILLFASGEAGSTAEMTEAILRRTDLLFIGNSTGQILFLGLSTPLIARWLHVGRGPSAQGVTSFLRLRWYASTPLYLLIAAVLFVVVQPLVMFLGYLNSLIPVPQSLSEFQVDQMRMIEQFLKSDGVLALGLFHIALVPSFAEEVFFRGYLFRAFEKSKGVMIGLMASSVLFGLFHLQLQNILPLSVLGFLLAILTWRSGSIWPAVLAHFVNNGSAVLAGVYQPDLAFSEMDASSLPSVPLIVISTFLTTFLLYSMFKRMNIGGSECFSEGPDRTS